MSAADVFNRVVERCPHQAGSGKWKAWIDAEMRKVEDIDGKVMAVRRKEEDERRRHKQAMAKLADDLAAIQPYCDHDMKRGTAEDEPSCQRCGWSGKEYRRS